MPVPLGALGEREEWSSRCSDATLPTAWSTASGLRPRAGQLLVVAVGVATGIPVIAAMVDRLSVDWVPVADNAIVGVRSLDVLSRHPPLVGQYSTGPSEVVGTDVYNLGPLLFALLALPARLPGTVCLELTMGLVNLACVLGVVALAHRRGGRPLMFAVALALPLMLASLPAESLSDIWNASAPLLPFTVLIFLAWSLGCGEYRLLPLTVVVASFTAQGHLPMPPEPRPVRGRARRLRASARVDPAPRCPRRTERRIGGRAAGRASLDRGGCRGRRPLLGRSSRGAGDPPPRQPRAPRQGGHR